jgi:hypothetical protein
MEFEFWINGERVGIVGEDAFQQVVDFLTQDRPGRILIIRTPRGTMIALAPTPDGRCEIVIQFTAQVGKEIDVLAMELNRKMPAVVSHFINETAFREFCDCLDMLPPHLDILELAVGTVCRFAKRTFLAGKISPVNFTFRLIESTAGIDQTSPYRLLYVHNVDISDELGMTMQVIREFRQFGPPHWKPVPHPGFFL